MKYILLAVIIFIMGSCEGILDESPESFIAPDQFFETEAEVEAAIYGVYDYLHEKNIAEAGYFLFGEMGTDVGNGRSKHYRNGDLDADQPSANMWKIHYTAIAASNLVIAKLENTTKFSDEFKNRILGEAKFLRGFLYFRLNLYWGNVPVWLDELDLEVVEYLPQSTAVDVRKQVVQDLSFAVDNLPATVSQNGRVTQWAAKGLLSRVYLFDKQWQNAKELAKDIMDNSGHELLPLYKDVFDWKNKFNAELIHVIPKIADIEGSTINTLSSPRPFDDGNKIKKILDSTPGLSIIRPDGVLSTDVESRNPGSVFQGWGSFQCLKEHYDSYAPGDTRKDMWWHDITFTDGSKYTFTGGGSAGKDMKGKSGYYPLKWIAFDEGPNNGGRDIHLQRLAELYLIYAEAENELNGPTTEAYSAINTIRRRAFGNNENDLSGLSKDQFRQAVMNENKWELGGEGLRRWYLWHWGYDVYKEAVEALSTNPLIAQNIKPHHIYWKIPDNELAKNTNLVQNPGY